MTLVHPKPKAMPPNNVEAEEIVISSLILDGTEGDREAYDEVASFLRPDDFYSLKHQVVYQVIGTLLDRGDLVDSFSIERELEEMGKIEEADGAYRVRLSVLHLPGRTIHCARIVHDLAVCRRLEQHYAEVVVLSHEGKLGEARSLAAELAFSEQTNPATSGELIPLSACSHNYFTRLDERHREGKKITGVPTGYTDLDRITGGLQKSDLLILAARPAVGKTSFAMSMAHNMALKFNQGVATFSMEMSQEQLYQRLLAMDAGVDQQRLRTGQVEDDEWEKLLDAKDRLDHAPIYIDDTPALTCFDIRSKVRRLMRERPIHCIMIDYLQLMRSQKRHENRVQEVSEISRDLKVIARELDMPVVALAQLSRAVESRQSKVPQLSDLRESGTIEQDCDVCMFIYREDIYYPDSQRPNQADIIVAKQRNGPTGEVALYFKKSHTRFENLEQTPDE